MKLSRNTEQRQVVRGVLKNNYTHPTADEIYSIARSQSPSISRGTVYRNLSILTESGEIARVKAPYGADHYDCNTAHHYHFLCRDCNKMLDAKLPYAEELNLATPDIEGCKTEYHKLMLIGLCPDCNK